MNEIYNAVPKIISTKDLDYLSDMFNWNYGAYKSSINALNTVEDEDIKNILEKSNTAFYNIMQEILNTLKEGNNNEQ